eukprot:gene8757-9655_t
MEGYQVFLDSLAQLEQDQTFYESELGGSELQGVEHEEIIKLGGLLVKRLHKFAEKGRSFADTLPPDFVNKLIDTIQWYQNLIMPPKVLGGLCPCLKPARSGPDYEAKYLATKARMVASLFNVQAVLIENKGEQHNMDSMHYADYVNKMNAVFNNLSDISCSGSSRALEAARRKLVAGTESVDKFLQHFGDSGGKPEFKAEATRRIKATQELLSNRPKNEEGQFLPLSRRVLIKAQSSLQEIMNSAAAIALSQSRENLDNLDKLAVLLKKTRDQEMNGFRSLEDGMHLYNLMDLLDRLREDSDIYYSDANSKLRDATKRWTSIKNQSQPRKVAEYVEETQEQQLLKPLPGIPINPDLDPQKIFQQTGKKISTVGKFAKGMVNVMGSELKGGVQNVVTSGANNMKNIGAKAAKVFNLQDENPSPQSVDRRSTTSSQGNNEKHFNPFESMMSRDSSSENESRVSATKKTSTSRFMNPLADLV